MNIYKLLDEFYKLLPIRWIITLLAKIMIGSTALVSYEHFIGKVPFLMYVAVTCWMLMQLYDMARYMIFGARCQTSTTTLWNMLESMMRLEEATEKRIKAMKLRIWVQQNPEINIFNYWIYKIIRRNEWVNIDCDAIQEESE